MGAPFAAALAKDTTIVWLDVVAVGAPGAPGAPVRPRFAEPAPMTSTVIGRLIPRSARPATSVTVATRLIVPTALGAAGTVTVGPLSVTVRPAARVTPITSMSGRASGLVTCWLRFTVTLWPALTVALTGLPSGS